MNIDQLIEKYENRLRELKYLIYNNPPQTDRENYHILQKRDMCVDFIAELKTLKNEA